MRTAILLLALVSAACALPPPPPPPSEWQEHPRGSRPAPTERSDSEERERAAIITIFDAIKEMSPASSGESRPGLALLENLRDILLASAADRGLSFQERNEKYLPAVYDALEEYARTSITDEKERTQLLTIILLARNNAYNQPSAAPDKAAFLSYINGLFDIANEPFPSWGQHDLDSDKQERDKLQFLTLLESTLNDIRMD